MTTLDAEEEQNNHNPWPIHAIRLLLLTGCRLKEILTLKWDEVDWENQWLRLRDSKTGKKLVYLSSAAIELFKVIPQEDWGQDYGKNERRENTANPPWVM